MNDAPDKTVASSDFPAWLAPSIVKELRQGMKTSAFTIMWIMVPVGMALLFLFGFLADDNGRALIKSEAVNGIFWTITTVILLVVTPARAFKSIREETDSRTIDLMILTRLTPFKIILGKWCSYMIQSLLVFSTLLPFFFMRYYYGNIDLVNDMLAIILILVASSILTAMAIWTSGFTTVIRTIITVFFVLPLIIFGVQISIAMIFTGGMFGGPVFPVLEDTPVVTSIVFLADAVILFYTFIILASRWIAPPSDNSSMPVRLLTLAAFLPLPLCLLSEGPQLLMYQGIFALFLSSAVIAIELTTPMTVMPVHFANVKGTRFAFFKTRCLMPGFYSASLFLIAYTLILLCLAAIFLLAGGLQAYATWISLPNYVNTTTVAVIAAMLILLWFFSVHAPSMILYPVQGKLKSGTLVLYYVISSFVIPFIGALVLTTNKLLAIFVPWVCLSYPFIINETDNHVEYMGGLVLGCIMTAVITVVGLVLIMNSNTHWKLAKLRASKLSYLD